MARKGEASLKHKIMICLNTSWNLVNFRSGLIQSLVVAGYEVVAVAPEDSYSPLLQTFGCRFVPLPMDNKGTHPGRDLQILWRFLRLLKRERPSVFLGYTVKPNVYGSIACHLLGIPVINNVAGLGTAFIRKSWVTGIVRSLYRLAFFRARKVFFQNLEDRFLFVSEGLVAEEKADCLPGSGIDLEKFYPIEFPKQDCIRFLMIGRMLWDKGVGEFVEAARLLKRSGLNAEYCLLGFLDAQNSTAVRREQMEQWVNEGIVHYLGVSDKISDEIAQSHCVVLPSYREGTSRTLLEAAAMARPIVTTDVAGCREVVDDGVNGLLCRVGDAQDLAEKMYKICLLDAERRKTMGLLGRAKAEREFDERLVIQKYLETIRCVLCPESFHH